MARHHQRLSRLEVEKIFYLLCLAVSKADDINRAAKFLRDLLSYQESEMIAKRLKIAELLLEGKTYSEIREILKVSSGTISRIHEWLKMSGEGYRWAVQNTKGEMKKIVEKIPAESSYSEWSIVKRRYPIYFWPQLLLEELIQNSNKRQRQRINAVMREMEKSKRKTPLYNRVAKLMGYGKAIEIS